MFAKLLKYEWKANVKLLSLLCGCALGLGGIAAIVLRLIVGNWDVLIAKETNILLLIPAFLFLFVAFFGILMLAPSVQCILLYRFYKSRFTDEGYLMFTLPVKTHHLFLSSALHLLIWGAIVFFVIILSYGFVVLLLPVWQNEVFKEFQAVFSSIPSDVHDLLGIGYVLTSLISMVIMCGYSAVAPMSAIVLGASVAKKHKILAIIGLLFGLSMITSTATGIITGILQLLTFSSNNFELIATLNPLAQCIVPLVFTIGGYILSIHIMKRRLNLP